MGMLFWDGQLVALPYGLKQQAFSVSSSSVLSFFHRGGWGGNHKIDTHTRWDEEEPGRVRMDTTGNAESKDIERIGEKWTDARGKRKESIHF